MASTMDRTETSDIRGLLEEIRAQVADLSTRVARLEQDGFAATPVEAVPAALTPEAVPLPSETEPIGEETLAVIAAVVAAILGEPVHIRQVRLLSSPAWAQQGRVSIQASHRLH